MASTSDHSTCPFCNGSYLKLGTHLPHCRERDGRDYTHLLSAKTLRKRFQSKKKSECPKCHRLFKRLDTHFRVSATCREINPHLIPTNPDLPSGLEQAPQGQSMAEDAIFFSPQDLNSAVTAPAAPLVPALATTTINTASHYVPLRKASLSLPTSDDGWKQADSFFQTSLVPAALAVSSPLEMNRVLCEGIYSYFASSYGTKSISRVKSKKRPLHNRALKEVERQKKEAKRELRSARSGSPVEFVQPLAQHFFSLVRAHSKLKRAADSRLLSRNVRDMRERCHRDLRSCAREILEGGDRLPDPHFNSTAAVTFFSEVYTSHPQSFAQPEWMPSPSPPEEELDCSPFSESEVSRVISKMKAQSAPSPFDGVGYAIFKRCPSLIPALVQLFNICWAHATIPEEWKCAAIKLIPKSSAADDATNPANFRPIALTPCIGKIFTSLLRNRWLRYMVANKYLDPSLQKAFMPTVPGCTEHHLKLSSVLAEAHSKHKALAICWLDLANAYGSVHHALIDFSLRHYHAPPQFLANVQALYTGLNAKVITAEWETPVIPLQKGVYQGDPLSVVIFNTVMNTLIDTVSLRTDLGYQFSESPRSVHILQYADDTCLVANSPASCQYQLSMVSDWLQWSGMAAKVPKCQCLSLQASTGRVVDPQLQLDGRPIPFTTDPVRFLGMSIHVPTTNSSSRSTVLSRLQAMLTAVDDSLLSRRQKLLLYSAGICPRLTWLLLIQEFPISWMEKEVDALATKYLKRWAGLCRSGNTAILHLPTAMGGLNLPRLSTLHKKLQVSRQCHLLLSRDGCVRFLADCNLKKELGLGRKKFKPAILARDTISVNPAGNRKSLGKAAKKLVQEDDDCSLLETLQGLDRQGQLSRCTDPKCAPLWAKVVQRLPDDTLKFAVNAAVDCLPHNSNLHRWKKRQDPACPLCHSTQTLLHVLNNCAVARDLRRYNARHDAVLQEIVKAVVLYLPPSSSWTADISDTYSFPTHIVPTDLRPDLVWWDSSKHSLCFVELTVCYDTNFEEASRRKLSKYEDLAEQARVRGYHTSVHTIQVGSRGVPDYDSFAKLADMLQIPDKELNNLLERVIRAALIGSFTIWCSRNRTSESQ